MMKRMMMFAAAVGLAIAASAATRLTVASGETATIGRSCYRRQKA